MFLLGLYVALVGGLSFIGWAADVPRLTDWDDDGISIQPNSTLAAMVAGAALMLLAFGHRRVAAGLGALAGLVGATSFLQHAAGVDLGIDTLLMFGRTWGRRGTLAPGRIGLPASLAWTLAGTGLVLQLGGAQLRRAASVLGLLVSGVAALSLTGYLFGADVLYSLPRITAIALQTSTILLALGLGLVAAIPERQPMRGLREDSAAGLLTRRTLPLVILLPLVVGWLGLAGQEAGLYDTAMGTALLVLALIGMLCGVLWWGASAVRSHEQAFTKAAETNARADLVLREVRDQFLILDKDWRHVFVNESVCQAMGLSREQLLGKRIWDIFPEARSSDIEIVARRVRERNEAEIVENYYARSDRWFENRVYPTPEGGVAIFSVELTERKRTEAALRESEERFRKLVSFITDVAWTSDVEGAFATRQPGWAAYTGQTWEEMRGFGWTDALHPDDRARVREGWEKAVKAGCEYESHGRIWHAPTREHRHFIARAAPLRNLDGTVLEWVGAYGDVHDARTRELALAEFAMEREELLSIAESARAEAERANRAKDDFLAILSHELRSPLNAMLGWVRILERASSGDATVTRAVETLERNIGVQTQIINDLLDISRITSGKLELRRSQVDIQATVAACVDSLRPMAEARRLAFEHEMPRERLEVDGDPVRLQQIVGNLLQNAVKFTPEGGRVSVRVRGMDGQVVIEVEDTGEGIDQALLPHIFDRFVQSQSSTTRRHGGLGLGLAIAKQLCLAHGGSVDVQSGGSGQGARFTVRLPLASPLAGTTHGVASGRSRRIAKDIASLDVILVEDHADAREALGRALEQSGARVRPAASARQALEEYDARPPDVLVSDIGMPDEDGYTLIRAIREREEGSSRRTIAIAMTGFASRQDHETALRAGFDDHVGKPVEVKVLFERMRVLAASREEVA